MPGRIPVDDPSVTTVESKEQLPEQEYRVGYFTGSGPGSNIEFQKTLETDRSPEQITGEMYARADQAYDDRELFVRGQEDQQFYDVNPIHEANGDLNLSEAEQHAESRSTVSESRGF